MKSYFKWILQKDYFAVQPQWNFKGSTHYSKCGALLTVLMFIFLAVYFFWSISEMVSTPTLTSSFIKNSKGNKLVFDELALCIKRPESRLSTQSPSDYIKVSYYGLEDGQEPITIPSEQNCNNGLPRTNEFCVCFSENDNIAIDTRHFVLFEVNQAAFSSNTIEYLLMHRNYDLDPNNRTDPLELTKTLSTTSAQGVAFTWFASFEKVVFEVDNNYFYSKKNITTTTNMESLRREDETNPLFKTHVQAAFSGMTTTNARTVTKITSIFAQVSGLKEVIALIITLFFGRYFEFKFFENLNKEVSERNTRVPYYKYLQVQWKKMFGNKVCCSDIETGDADQIQVTKADYEDNLDVVNYCKRGSNQSELRSVNQNSHSPTL